MSNLLSGARWQSRIIQRTSTRYVSTGSRIADRVASGHWTKMELKRKGDNLQLASKSHQVDAERHRLHSHVERGNDKDGRVEIRRA